ncbi:CPBP family intramembrane glutamic endopeptidase [Methanobacterium oryzae]|uniref:CPBP family intramembrane glutamic endopeptidase n=1 Tax=Methanobacterium oryzae TaxID=69540 RepID=UPI003D252F43
MIRKDSLMIFQIIKRVKGNVNETNPQFHSLQKKIVQDTKLVSKHKFNITYKSILVLLGYLALIILSEIVNAYYNIEAGLIIDVLVICFLLIHSSLVQNSDYSNLLRSMMILPMIRIIGLSVPLMQVQALYWFPIIAIPLFAASFTLIRVQKLKRKDLGLNFGNIPVQLVIASSGFLLGFTEYKVLAVKPLISTFDPLMIIFAGTILLISTGFAEELLFRGILQQNTEKIFGSMFGLLYASLLFTSLHIGWHSIIDLIFVFAVSMFYGYMFQKTRSLFGITLSHGISNTTLFLIMPFIVF